MLSSRSFRNSIFSIFLIVVLTSCASTKYYTDYSQEILSEDATTSSIHYRKDSKDIKVDKKPNCKITAFYLFGLPLEIVGCTFRETGRVIVYALANTVMGYKAYYKYRPGYYSVGLWLPDTDKTKRELVQLKTDYENSPMGKYKKYVSKLSYNTITKKELIEDVNWDEDTQVISSTTETIYAEEAASDTAKRVSKKASLIGGYIGEGAAIVFSAPSFFLGMMAGAAADTD